MAASFLVTFLLFFLPFIILPFGTSYFETPKVIIFEICTILLFGLFISQNRLIKTIKSQNKYILLTYILLIVLIIYDLIFKTSSISFFGNQFRHQGIFLLGMLLIFSVVSSQINLGLFPKWIYSTLLLVELVSCFFLPYTLDGRSVGTLGEPNALAGFAVFLLPFVLFTKDKRNFFKSNIIVIGSIIMTLCIVLVSGSRSGLVAFIIEIIFYFSYHFFHVSINKTTIICGFIFLLSLLLPFFQTNVVYENRAQIWNAALVAGYKYPILGWGFGNAELALQAYDKKLYNNEQGYYVDSSHNIFLDWWIQSGFTGLAIFILILYFSFKIGLKRTDEKNILLLFVLLTCLSFNPASVVSLLAFWWIIGQLLFE